jgi:hypothetical protein
MVFPPSGNMTGNNVSCFAHLRETCLGNKYKQCFLVCPLLGNMAKKLIICRKSTMHHNVSVI